MQILSESGAVVADGRVPRQWPFADPDMESLRRQPEFYAAYLDALDEDVHDAMTVEEAERWLRSAGQ